MLETKYQTLQEISDALLNEFYQYLGQNNLVIQTEEEAKNYMKSFLEVKNSELFANPDMAIYICLNPNFREVLPNINNDIERTVAENIDRIRLENPDFAQFIELYLPKAPEAPGIEVMPESVPVNPENSDSGISMESFDQAIPEAPAPENQGLNMEELPQATPEADANQGVVVPELVASEVPENQDSGISMESFDQAIQEVPAPENQGLNMEALPQTTSDAVDVNQSVVAPGQQLPDYENPVQAIPQVPGSEINIMSSDVNSVKPVVRTNKFPKLFSSVKEAVTMATMDGVQPVAQDNTVVPEQANEVQQGPTLSL